jgi:hypothetical protein
MTATTHHVLILASPDTAQVVHDALDSALIRAKLLFFSAFFRHRIAMEQSIQELEKVYDRFMEQHPAMLSQISAKKELLASLSTFINQVHPFVSRIQAATFSLRQAPDDKDLTLPALVHQAIHALDRAVKQGGNQIQS